MIWSYANESFSPNIEKLNVTVKYQYNQITRGISKLSGSNKTHRM